MLSWRRSNDPDLHSFPLPSVAFRCFPLLSSESGQGVIAGAVAVFVALAILVPTIAFFVQKESKETEKERKMTAAFQLAEAATERGYWEISQLSSPTAAIPIPGYNFDQEYTDVTNGSYAVAVGSDSAMDIIITGVGRDTMKKEVREIQVTYALPAATNSSMFSAGANTFQGSEDVEWGPIYSQTGITSGADHPRLYTNGVISGYGPSNCSQAPPCTDNLHYWSCSCAPYIAVPAIDFNYYKQLAQTEGNTAPPNCCGGSYYNTASCEFQGCTDTSGSVYYFDNNSSVSFKPSNFIVGTIIVSGSGSLSLQGHDGSGGYAAAIPPYAWREYCTNTTVYSNFAATFVSGSPPSYASSCGMGINTDIQDTGGTANLSDVLVHGFVYVGSGGMTMGGSGNTVIHGALYSSGSISGGAHLYIYYDNEVTAGIHTTSSPGYTRLSWKEIVANWPSGLP